MKKFLMTIIAIATVFTTTTFAGYINSNNSFMTRGMAIQKIYELAGKPTSSINAPFIDNGTNYENAINWAYENKILLGFGDGTCRPNENITREQFATLLNKWAGMPKVNGSFINYDDRDKVSDWAYDAMHWCVNTGIIKGRETNLICPEGVITVGETEIMINRFRDLPNIENLTKDIETLSISQRSIGSEGEKNAVTYISQRFEEMGYELMLQEYAAGEDTVGNNVIATRKAKTTLAEKAPDILVISAHHDSVVTAFGANDNASGVAALLQVADLLKAVETDTELRFISFTDEENGKNGSRKYVDSLSKEEKDRIIGCIQFDMLGGLGSNGIKVATTDGSENWLSKLIKEQDSDLTFGNEENSDHAIFQIAGIPSVVVTQNGRGYLYHSAGDTKESINPWLIYRAANNTANVVKFVASDSTPSYQEIVKDESNKHFYSHSRASKILYSASREMNEAYLGFSGKLIKEWEEVGDFWCDKYEVYMYQMGWFGEHETMETHYTYRNGYLENVEIYPDMDSFTKEELITLITNTHGTPLEKEEGSENINWQDEIYGKYISLKESEGKISIAIYSYSLGISNVLANYECVSGDTVIDNPMHKQVWDLLCSFLPVEHRQNIGGFRLFTDGYSNILAYTSTMGDSDEIDNTKFVIAIDYYDVYDEYGNPRDWSKLINTIIHEYGHVILENDKQIDVSIDNSLRNPEAFIKGEIRQRYYEEFWKDPYSSYLGSYWENPKNYVSEYAGNMFHEDIADTFAVFVLAAKPTGESIAERKILFFWDDEEMVNLRSDIRKGLGLN